MISITRVADNWRHEAVSGAGRQVQKISCLYFLSWNILSGSEGCATRSYINKTRTLEAIMEHPHGIMVLGTFWLVCLVLGAVGWGLWTLMS